MSYRVLPRKTDMDVKHERLDIDILWVCVVCATDNIDNPRATAEPMCSDCSNTYTWDELNKLFCLCQVGVHPSKWRLHTP